MKILITGASGSIGKEIVNQLIVDNEIICFDRNEEKAFYLEKEIREKHPDAKLTVCLGSITDIDRIEQVFNTHKPDIVYHTAANKHVPLGEDNIHEFVYNNIQGTVNLSEVALSYGCKFVFISTDKAVEPCSVMGYTKRMCEKYLLSLNSDVVICRFGNIIASSGSVYEIFDRQSKTGKLTVTHVDMERYFISAVQKADIIVGHNVEFDRIIIIGELMRMRESQIYEESTINASIALFVNNSKFKCSMQDNTSVLKIISSSPYGGYKWPKLMEAYKYYFTESANNMDASILHNSLYDTIMCIRIYCKYALNIDIFDYIRGKKERIIKIKCGHIQK